MIIFLRSVILNLSYYAVNGQLNLECIPVMTAYRAAAVAV